MEFRKKKKILNYPQPIIKDLNVSIEDKQPNPPSFLEKIHSDNMQYPPSKIVRSSHIKPIAGKLFNLVLHPFDPSIVIPSV